MATRLLGEQSATDIEALDEGEVKATVCKVTFRRETQLHEKSIKSVIYEFS